MFLRVRIWQSHSLPRSARLQEVKNLRWLEVKKQKEAARITKACIVWLRRAAPLLDVCLWARNRCVARGWRRELWMALLQKGAHPFLRVGKLRRRGHDLAGVVIRLVLRQIDLRIESLLAYTFREPTPTRGGDEQTLRLFL